MGSVRLLGVGSLVVFGILAACVGDDPGGTSSSSSGGASSSGTVSSSGTTSGSSGASSGTSGGPCAGDTIDACGAACTKCTAPTGGTVACTGGNCVPSCDPAQTLCTDKCIATQTTKEHCGKCGHSCNGGDCVAAACQPVQIASATKMLWFDVGAAGVVMSMDDTKVRLCDLATGCNEAQLKPIASGLSYNQHVVVSGNTVFFDGQTGDPYLIYKCATTGCPGSGPDVVENIVNDSIGNIVAGPNALVWTRYQSYYGPYSNKCALPACSSVENVRLKPTTGPYYSDPAREQDVPSKVISAGVNTTLWSTGGLYNASVNLRSCALGATCSPIDIPGAGAQALTYYDGKHYGAGNSSPGDAIFTIADTVGTTTRTPIVNDDDGISDVAVDASGIYWVNSTTGQVRRCATLAGCSAAQIETLATGQTGATKIRVDAANVYWMTSTKVFRVVKP